MLLGGSFGLARPGAIVISNINTQTRTLLNNGMFNVSNEKIGTNFLGCLICNGTTEGLKLAVNVGSYMLLVLWPLSL